MSIGIIVQARMGSTRLPGKILLPFYEDKTLIDILLANLHKIDGVKVIVATSINPNNDQLEEYLIRKNELVYRGSENDVLDRFIQSAEVNDVDSIIRICSDNPFLDVDGIKALVAKASVSKADYIGFRINDKPSIKTHFGFWGEFVRLSALKRVKDSTIELPAHEHVTIHLYTHPEEFNCEWIECPNYLQGREDIRLTIDTPEDLKNASKVYSDIYSVNPNFTLLDVVEYLDSHPTIKNSMLTIISNNQK